MMKRLLVMAGTATIGLILAAPAASYADSTSAGNTGVGNGNQVEAPVQVPVNVCGNGTGVLGVGIGTCKNGTARANPPSHHPSCPAGYGEAAPQEATSNEVAQAGYCSSSPSTPPSSTPSSVVPTTPVSHTQPTQPMLPVTGTSVTILVAVALALVAGGAGFLYFARRRRA